jgi:trk system potassium uptake protein TrkH
MSFLVVLRILGAFLVLMSGFMIFPLIAGVLLQETQVIYPFLTTIFVGISFFLFQFLVRRVATQISQLTQKQKRLLPQGKGVIQRPKGILTVRGGFLFVALAWLGASALGALPFYLSGSIPSYTSSYFETMSGFTTTGASILTDIESLPRSILLWRSITHWLGGMGIVVLTVALFPLLGVGGFHLVRAEAPGPTVDRITETAKLLWFIYLAMTVVQTILLMVGGMDLIDSLIHTFGTLATGGFSSNNASVGGFNSPYIHGVITVFMVMAGVNFTLYHRLFTGSLGSITSNSEFKAYITVFFVTAAIIVADLFIHRVYPTILESIQFGSFQAASIMTTTGYATADYDQWPRVSRAVLFFLMFVGGSSGSTGGGIKVIRLVILFKLAGLHLKKLLEPRGVFTLRMNGRPLQDESIEAIAGFVFFYVGILLLLTGAVAFAGEDLLSSFSAALATLGNIGPGFGSVGPTMNYAHFPPWLLWVFSFAMMLGRLEIYTVLVIFTPMFWRRS